MDDLYGQAPTITGPLFDTPDPWPLFAHDDKPLSGATQDELRVAGIIMEHAGSANPVSIAAIREQTGLSERQVKGVVERLVVEFRLKIGARREEPSGYFIICSASDQEAAVGPYKAQILAMWKRLRVLEAPHALRELLGQLRLED